jgi:hypothetical protein
MAQRPIFIPNLEGFPFVKEMLLEFEWHAGFAKVQAQKSIASLHMAAARAKIEPILEISSKSTEELGISLSSFNLKIVKDGKSLSVECAYQGSKFFANGGPFSSLYFVSSREAKTDERLRNSGEFVGYEFFGESFPINPVTAFYDWLYLNALSQNLNLAEKLLEYKSFSDIAFNPKKSLNCQARAAALFVTLHHNGEVQRVIEDRDYYFDLIANKNLKDIGSLKNSKNVEKSKGPFSQLELPL